jgi:methylenetetrahydrofolate--tRNA-(uracil-5-)-methyltransferase
MPCSPAKAPLHDWENIPYFDGCLPIEVMAERGRETLRHGPMKPFGLTNAHNPQVKPYAVVQLRQDNALGTLFNMVGFQTKLRYGEQAGIFRMIPGLERAEFARLGGLHRNTFLNSPKLLDGTLRLKAMPRLRFAGQITGCEGYVESAAIGLLAGRFAAAERLGSRSPHRRRRPLSARSSATSPAGTSRDERASARSSR